MSFELMLQQALDGDVVEILPGWGQGRACFGGVLGALAAARLQAVLGAQQNTQASLRALTISFVAPVAVGPVQIEARILRSGKSVTQMECHMRQEGEVVLAALASFGSGRNSSVRVPSLSAPALASPEQGRALPWIPGVVPEFTRMVDYRYLGGAFPFSHADTHNIDGWMRWSAAAGVNTARTRLYDLIALLDAWPPSTLQMLAQPAPASSLTWTVEFPALEGGILSEDANPWWQYHAHAESSDQGYGHIAAHCWNENGQLVAISRQTVTLFA